jgi:hypothetical protein
MRSDQADSINLSAGGSFSPETPDKLMLAVPVFRVLELLLLL